jgi:hypothetical protein
VNLNLFTKINLGQESGTFDEIKQSKIMQDTFNFMYTLLYRDLNCWIVSSLNMPFFSTGSHLSSKEDILSSLLSSYLDIGLKSR